MSRDTVTAVDVPGNRKASAMNASVRNRETNEAYEQVMDAIVTQELAPGQKVSEQILSDTFGISRTVSRNLIEHLVSQQFLVSLSARVTQVAPLTLSEIKQNFLLRKIMLSEMAALSAARVDFEELERLIDVMPDLYKTSDDKSALVALKTNKQLNLEFCSAADYPLGQSWLRQLEDTAMRILWLHIKTRNEFPFSIEQQRSVVSALKSDDATRIKRSVVEALDQSEERTLSGIYSHEQFLNQNLMV